MSFDIVILVNKMPTFNVIPAEAGISSLLASIINRDNDILKGVGILSSGLRAASLAVGSGLVDAYNG